MVMTIITAAASILVVILKGIFGTDAPLKHTTADVKGEPLGPRLSARLRELGGVRGDAGERDACYCRREALGHGNRKSQSP